ncbi:hypothetical protein D3C87_1276710 [compost metagenome]
MQNLVVSASLKKRVFACEYQNCQLLRCIACVTQGGFRWRSSKCSRGVIWVRTISSDLRIYVENCMVFYFIDSRQPTGIVHTRLAPAVTSITLEKFSTNDITHRSIVRQRALIWNSRQNSCITYCALLKLEKSRTRSTTYLLGSLLNPPLTPSDL